MKTPIRVVQLVTGLAIGEMNGGAELFASRLANALDPKLIKASIYCLWSHNTATERHWAEELTKNGISVIMGEPYDPNFRRSIIIGFLKSRSKLAAIKPDILQSHTELADVVGLFLRMSRSVPCAIRSCHNTVEWNFARHLGFAMDILSPVFFDVETSVASAAKQRLDNRPLARLLNHKTVYIPTAIDQKRVLAQITNRDIRSLLSVRADSPLLICVGRLSHQKGIDILLQSMVILSRHIPNIHLWIVGQGEEGAELEKLARNLNLERHVTFLGKRTDVADLLRVADLFVSASRWEGLPAVVMEAMLVGTPIVATDITGSNDLIHPGRNGWLARANDPIDLAKQIQAALQTPDLGKHFAQQARGEVAEYSIDRLAAQYTELYIQLMQGRAHTSLSPFPPK